MEIISFHFSFIPGLLYIVELESTVLQNHSDSGATTTINNKISFSVVCLSGPTRLIRKFTFALFLFYPNQCRLSGRPPLGGLLENTVDLSCLLEAGFNLSQFKM